MTFNVVGKKGEFDCGVVGGAEDRSLIIELIREPWPHVSEKRPNNAERCRYPNLRILHNASTKFLPRAIARTDRHWISAKTTYEKLSAK